MREMTPRIQTQPASSRTSRRLLAFALLLQASTFFAAAPSVAAGAVLELDLHRGVQARIFSADYVEEHWVRESAGRAWLEIPGYGSTELILPESGDPSSAYHPHAALDVYDALAAVVHTALPETLSVFCLPYPRKGLTSSSTAGARIFLSPGALPIPREVTHMVATHELGHAMHNRHLPESDTAGWQAYRKLRDIEDTSVYCADALHRNRPREIFAEDFRYLCGGALANYSGTIENGALPAPDAVPGLHGFLLALGQGQVVAAGPLVASNYPNPFNPQTRLALAAAREQLGLPLTIEVFDAAGRRVRTLYLGTLERLFLEVEWDGRDERGGALASGVYFARIRLGEQRLSHKMLLIG